MHTHRLALSPSLPLQGAQAWFDMLKEIDHEYVHLLTLHWALQQQAEDAPRDIGSPA